MKRLARWLLGGAVTGVMVGSLVLQYLSEFYFDASFLRAEAHASLRLRGAPEGRP